MHEKHKIVKNLIVTTLLIACFTFFASAGSNCIPHCESSHCSPCSCAEATIANSSCNELPEAWDSTLNEAKFPPKELLSAILPPHYFILPTDIAISKIPANTKYFQPGPLYSIIFSRAPPHLSV